MDADLKMEIIKMKKYYKFIDLYFSCCWGRSSHFYKFLYAYRDNGIYCRSFDSVV